MWTLKRVRYNLAKPLIDLTSETVQSTSLSLQSIDYVHGCYGFPLGMLGVGDSITNDILKEYLKNTTSLFVDKTRDTFYTTTTCKTSDSGFGNTLDVITKNFAMTLSASLSESLASFAATSHVEVCCKSDARFKNSQGIISYVRT